MERERVERLEEIELGVEEEDHWENVVVEAEQLS